MAPFAIALLAASAFADPAKPNLPDQFSANLSSKSYFGTFQNGTIYYDAPAKKMRNDDAPFSVEEWIGIPGVYKQSNIYTPTGSYWITNDVCRNQGGKFYDLWGWVQAAKYYGTARIGDVECNIWKFFSSKTNITLYEHGDLPVMQVIETVGGLPGMTPQKISIEQVYLNITLGKPAEKDIALPAYCTEKPATCAPQTERVITMDHYIAHPPDHFNITDQDTADLLGDTVFTCSDVKRNHTKDDHYGVISHYRISVDTTWGQYALCNGYPGVCVGNEDFFVGREASMGIKEKGGQCANNSDVGTWYSFPAAGQCQSRGDLDAHKCTWFIEERVKTINLTCPFDTHKMLAACNEEPQTGQSIFAKASQIFAQSFASDDVADGGCPDLGGATKF
uniref:Uncharacterized protein n=1 Tax=Lotharella oceanica TaxID=641309 RepID=A0A7S2TW06_9EUKA|mmetsp:Transcript_2955/g.5714  ORF Transcript_2955/g.5714 Transcript_2955/m.5714 type:complete len:392 (+) Transcript_2955:28-1203(+)